MAISIKKGEVMDNDSVSGEKICVTSQGDNLNSQVDSRFGRCRYFIIADVKTLEFEAVENSNINGMGGVGVQSGQLMANKGVRAVLTGNIGPNAFQTLQAAGIEMVTGVSGTIKEAIEKYNKGEIKPNQKPSVDSHFGIK